ncbi:MAG: hypothetical protein KDE14_07520 [Rhodobacteraceae bacterium]|nr:hypothetical protein [Planctomycetales bacterium]MCB2107532.1 hypothetical protein [Paracoccaceae bacterium]
MSNRIKTPRRTKAMRPQYFSDPNMDQMHAMIVAMAAEISVLYDRFDTMERIMDAKGVVSRSDIEDWRPDEAAYEDRKDKRDDLIRRIFRSVHDARARLDDK